MYLAIGVGRFEVGGFFSLERCRLRPPQGKGGAFPLWGGREIQNPVSDRHPVGHLGPQLAGIRYLGSQKGVKKVSVGLEGSSPARHLGPPPRIDLKFGSMDACRSRAARNRRVLRSWRPLRPLILARSARDVRVRRDMPMQGPRLARGHYSKCRHRTSPKLEI